MKTSEKSNGSLAQLANNRDNSSMPGEFAGLYQAGYEAGYASGRESGYRQGHEAGFWDGRRQGDAGSTAAPAAVENAAERVAVTAKSRLFGLPCTKCRRLMYSDETRCAYCKAPRAARLGDPPSATSCGPEEGSQREPDGGLQPLRISRENENNCRVRTTRGGSTGCTRAYDSFDGSASAIANLAVRDEQHSGTKVTKGNN